MNLALPYIDRIWRAEGEIALDPPLAAEEAFARLDPLFQTPGTTNEVSGVTMPSFIAALTLKTLATEPGS